MTPSPRSCTRCARSAAPGEGSPRHALLAARGRRWRAAAAEVRDAPAGARDRDARARARRPGVDPPRRRARAADAGVDPPRRATSGRAPAGRPRSCTDAGARARRQAGAAPRRGGCSSPTRTCRGTLRDPGRDSPRAARGDRRRHHDLAAASLHLLGAAVKRASGAAWVADLRDPLVRTRTGATSRGSSR